MTKDSEKMIDDYIQFVSQNIEKFSKIGEISSNNEVPPTKVAWAMSQYYDVCMTLHSEYQRVKTEKVALELEYEELYAEWFQEAKNKLVEENSAKSAKPALKEIEQQLKTTHKMDYFSWQRRLSEAELKCDFFLRLRETLNKYDSILTNMSQMLRAELRSLNIEDRANAREKFAPVR